MLPDYKELSNDEARRWLGKIGRKGGKQSSPAKVAACSANATARWAKVRDNSTLSKHPGFHAAMKRQAAKKVTP